MNIIQDKTLDLRFYSNNGLFKRDHKIADVQVVYDLVDQFIKYIDRDDLFDVAQATESIITTGIYDNGQLMLRLYS